MKQKMRQPSVARPAIDIGHSGQRASAIPTKLRSTVSFISK